ncbi:MAG TPA: hypothetical protein VF082_06010 [Jiangellaceae bacterium]
MPTHERHRASTLSVVIATLAGSLLLLLALPNVVPVIRAARADGDPGTFVAGQLSCVGHLGHEACSWSGTFRPRDGGEVRADVYLYGSDRDTLRPGQRASAVDTGQRARVYPPTGSNEWVVTTGVLAGGLLLLAPLGRRAAGLLGPRRRRAHSGTPG